MSTGFYDFEVTFEGSIARIRPTTNESMTWLDATAEDGDVFMGGAMIVRRDEVEAFAIRANAAGFGVEW